MSRVVKTDYMFYDAISFNSDLSFWDVRRVASMHHMFYGATSFRHILCGEAWVHSKAMKDDMFVGSSGNISQTVCAALTSTQGIESKPVCPECDGTTMTTHGE